MVRDRDQESSEVRNLILRTLEQEQEVQQEQQSTDSESDQEDLNGTYEVERDDDPRLMRVNSLTFAGKVTNFLSTLLTLQRLSKASLKAQSEAPRKKLKLWIF